MGEEQEPSRCSECGLVDRLTRLSQRELQVVRLRFGGASLRTTAAALRISQRSVRKYIQRALLKLSTCRAGGGRVEA